MSLISYKGLVEMVKAGVINANPENINGASIDITLDNIIRTEFEDGDDPLTSSSVYVNLSKKENITTDEMIMDKFGYCLKPGEFVLASSVEVFNLPRNIAAEYKLKSSLARNGLQHMLAGWCDPGWTNSKLTLELYNATRYHNLLIQPGMKIGQMVFWQCYKVPESESYAKRGQYNNQDKVTGSKGIR